MTLFTPWAAFWLLVALVPILLVLYLLRLRRARQFVPCTSLWMEAAQDIQANVPFQRLRLNLLLALQLLALMLVGLAIAQPRLESAAGRGGRTVLLIDRSASMKATDGDDGGSRFEDAIEKAEAAIDRLHPGGWFADAGGSTMIVTLGESARIEQPFTSSRRALLDALKRLAAADTRGRLSEGMAIAQAWASQPDPDNPRVIGEPARIEVFTDGGLVDLGEVAIGSGPMLVHLVGAGQTSNRSVQSVVAERLPDDPEEVQVFASLVNWSPEPAEASVQMALNGTPVHIEDVSLPAGRGEVGRDFKPGVRDIVFTSFKRPEEVLVEVSLLQPDELAADDVDWTVVPATGDVNIGVYGSEPGLMIRAMKSLGRTQVRSIAVAQEHERIPETDDVLVLIGKAPNVLPDAPTLSMNVPLPSQHVRWIASRESDSLVPGTVRHPVLRGGPPQDLWVANPQGVEVAGVAEVLLEGTGGPLVLAWEEGGHRRIHIAFDPAESTWPWDQTFMTFLVDAVDWLARRGDAGGIEPPVAGDIVTVPLPAGVAEVTATSPSGEQQVLQVPAGRGSTQLGPLEEAGPWLVMWDGSGAGHQLIAAHLPSADEGQLLRAAEVRAGGVPVQLGSGAGRSVPLWPWALAASLLVLLVEWAVYTRRLVR